MDQRRTKTQLKKGNEWTPNVFLVCILVMLVLYVVVHEADKYSNEQSALVMNIMRLQSFSNQHKTMQEEDLDSQDPPPIDDYYNPFGDKDVRTLRGYGSPSYLFVVFGAYRGGPHTFAVVGIGDKITYKSQRDAGFECEWIPSPSSNSSNNETQPIKTWGNIFNPSYNFGNLYTSLVVNCTFDRPVGNDSQGGQLILHGYYGVGWSGESSHVRPPPERIPALYEKAGSFDPSKFPPLYKYDFLHCGGPLFGHINTNRIREWIAYHVKLFGPRSHFVFHDAGGMNAEIRKVLDPWVQLGYASIENVRHQADFDNYYYNQFAILNDCVHRTKFLANWTFIFDVDEYLFIGRPNTTLHDVMQGLSQYSQIVYRQLPMSHDMCFTNSTIPFLQPLWGFEKLMYKKVVTEDKIWSAYKSAMQARNVLAAGVHMAEGHYITGNAAWLGPNDLVFYHYHGTIDKEDNSLCQKPSNDTSINENGDPYEVDESLSLLGSSIKEFEQQQIGHLVRNT